MSTLSSITVKECDGCGLIATLRSDREYFEFESTWYEGTVFDFCAACKPNYGARISEDQKFIDWIGEALSSDGDEVLDSEEIGE